MQGARKSEYNLENCKNTYENTVMKMIEQINEDNNDKNKNKIRIDNRIKYGKRSWQQKVFQSLFVSAYCTIYI